MSSPLLPLEHRYAFRGWRVAWGSIGVGEPVVLVHGFPWSSQAWRRIAPWLATRRTVYYFDMLGCGLSEKSDEQDVSERTQSDLLAALIGHWQLERPQAIGHDFGGLAVLRAHFVNGVEYGAMHLVDAVAVLPSGSAFYRHVAGHEQAFAGLPAYAHEALLSAYIGQAAHYPLRQDALELYIDPWRGADGQAAFYRQIAQADTGNIAEAQSLYAATAFDVHLVWGERDTFIPPRRGRALRDLLGAKSFTCIPNAAHLVHEDAPEALLGALSASL